MKWLFPAETVMVIYALFTLVLVLFMSTKIEHPEAMAWERVRVVLTTVAVWIVYRIWPCRLTAFARIGVLLAYLSWWYPDTYELSKYLPNLDPLFAGIDQSLFGCQPALLWSQQMPSIIVYELMDFGYLMYFPIFVLFIVYVFVKRHEEFQKVSFIILAAFYIFYAIYDLVPVTGPQYYYLAVGVENIAAGVFPDVGNYFVSHTEMMPSPGNDGGFFHTLLVNMHSSGERPTAAFPSSHVGIATLTMALAIKLKEWRYAAIMALPYILLCLSTVYILAHYVIDAMAGFVFALVMFFTLDLIYDNFWGKSLCKSRK